MASLLTVGLDNDVTRYVHDLCSLVDDNNATCQLVSADGVEAFKLNASFEVPTPCDLPSSSVDATSRCELLLCEPNVLLPLTTTVLVPCCQAILPLSAAD